ncbi:MAG TPA: TerB N-terminal domain-containing protein [Mycobacteriales bacterium]|nr:TerB N-terminal domain-containing protein [Mycobacteriales bacterium]
MRPAPPAPRYPTGWIPPGTPIRIAGYAIAGGMIYGGFGLSAVTSGGAEPALIDPGLPVGRRPDRSGSGMTYWPSYHQISPECRAGYLEWLAAGRSAPGAYIGYVFLFFYGLERRVLVDCARPGPARADLPVIHAEIRRLLSIYGANDSFRGYATGLLDVVASLGARGQGQPPAFDGDPWEVPLPLRIGLAEAAAAGRPVPASWALAWVRFHPEIHLRTAARRCPDEFARLFAFRYRARFGDGMTVRPNRTTVRLEYRAASAGIGRITLDTGLPDVFGLAAPGRTLAALVTGCTDELDPYSRWLGRNPDGQGTIAGAALLPACLVDPGRGAVGDLLRWADAQVGAATHAIIDGADLIGFWTPQRPATLPKADSVAVARLLAGQGYGIEPDPRFGAAPLAAGPAVLFRLDPADSPSAPSAGYTAAATLMHLAAAVAGADDDVSESERAQLAAHLHSALHLSAAERSRLEAHLLRLLTVGVKLTGLTGRLRALTVEQREGVAAFCVRIAAADGVLAASEMAILAKVYTLLGLDATRVPGDAHALITTAPATVPPTPPDTVPDTVLDIGPVTVRPAGAAPSGYPIPVQRREVGFHLDEAAIAAKLAESEQVSALLGQIFAEQDSPAPEPVAAPEIRTGPPAAGLDGAHSALLRALAGRPAWSRAEVEDLCAGLGLLPDGALDTLNDAAFDTAGEPVAEGEDPIQTNTDAMREMLA